MRTDSGGRWPYPGARWWKFDLHTHTPASKDTHAWQKAIGTPREITQEKWLLRYMEAGIDCVAITDHNTGEWIDQLKKAYACLEKESPSGFRPLSIFPGVEISVNSGFHVLAIFDPSKTSSDIDTLLGKVVYDGEKGRSDEVTRKSAVEVIEAIVAAGGLAIPAHVDRPKGLLWSTEEEAGSPRLDPKTLEQVLSIDAVLAMEVCDRSFEKPGLYKDARCTWSEVLGSDCHNFQKDPRPGSRFTWVKMTEPSLEGLKLALMDGERFSLRRSDDPEDFEPSDLPEHFIERIEIKEARYMGRGEPAVLAFSPWFNGLVGGRGTGKSTVVHFLRLAYRRNGELDKLSEESETRRAFERFQRVPKTRDDQGGLQGETEALLSLARHGVQHRLRWRQDGEGTVVEEEKEERWQPSQSQDVTAERFPVRLFNQGQIAALAGESQEALLAVIDEAARTQREKKELEEAGRRFLALRAQIRELEGKLEERSRLEVGRQDVHRKLRRFEEARHADVLKKYQARTRQEREVMRQISSADATANRVEELAGEISPEDLPEGLFDREQDEDREALEVVAHVHGAIEDTRLELLVAAAELRAKAQGERDQLAKTSWHSDLVLAREAYDSLVKTLKAQGIADPSEYGKLVQERHRLEQEAARLDSLEEERAQIARQAEKQLQRVLEKRRALSTKRDEFLRQSLAGNEYVRIQLVPYGSDPRSIEASLREALGASDDRFSDDILRLGEAGPEAGLVAELLTAGDANSQQPRSKECFEKALDTLRKRIAEACKGKSIFGGHFSNYLKREHDKKPEFLDRVEIWFPEDSLQVKYSPKGDGRAFRDIGQASAGQRSAAMLAFLLAHGGEPLVLDQPEDDLDNHLIYDLEQRPINSGTL